MSFIVIGFIITSLLQWQSIRTTIDVSRHTESINLARTLYSEYSRNKLFLKMEESIVNGDKLYDEPAGENGKYSWQEINLYLGFFEQIGFFYKIDVFDVYVVDFYFGGAIVGAYCDEDVRAYVNEMRTDGAQPTAFEEFQKVAEQLIEFPPRATYIEECATGYRRWDEKF